MNNMEVQFEEMEVKDPTTDENVEIDVSSSEILKFYEGATIFLTGGTGFLGKLILEKILRTCSNISRIYLLVRPKRGLNPQERLEKIVNNVLFEKMRTEHPKFHEKVSLIIGDCMEPDLGLSEEDRQTLIHNVDIVFHVAATVKFNDIIRKATYINVRATRDVLKLSKQMDNLKAFVHVSTAYSNCVVPKIDEIFYNNTDMTGDKLIGIVDSLDDEQLETLTPTLIEKWPNTYSYTKAIAEKVVRQYGQNMPISIIRPSIVVSTYKEPLGGWMSNFFGPVGMALGIATGLIRVLRCNPDCNLDIVPADYCINAAISSAWVVGKKNNNSNVVFDDLKMEDNIPIFNYVGSCQKPLTSRQFEALCKMHGPKIPSMLCIWYYCSWYKPNKYRYYLAVLLFHYFPALLADIGLLITGRNPMMVKAYKKIHTFSEVNSYFTLREWIFTNHNTQAIWKKLNPTDKRLFEFDMGMLSWKEYGKVSVIGARVYLLKDPMDTLPKSIIRHRKLKILHYIVVTLYYLLLISILWKLDCSPLMVCCLVGLYKFAMG